MENNEHHMPAEDLIGTSDEKITNKVILDDPIKRSNSTVTEVTLRTPNSGELRGVPLQALADLDVIALQRVLPRITTPALTAQEIAKMSPSDLMQMGVKVAVFLLPKADRAMVYQRE